MPRPQPRADAEPPARRFTAGEKRIVARLRTPLQVQRWLDRLPYNWERHGETLRTFRGVVRRRRAHCLEAALSAAAILERHGWPPLLLDIESVDGLDHVLFLFRTEGGWGTVARSRDPGLHGRRPVFPSVARLVESYRAPYIDRTGRIQAFGVLDLRGVKRDWRLAEGDVWWVERALIANAHTRSPTPYVFYRRWKRRYDRFKAENPRGRPVHFPGRRAWLT